MSPETYKAITETPYQHQEMTPVQAAIVPKLPELVAPYDKDGKTRDLLVRARTGTGKTLAFLLPAIEARLRARNNAGAQAMLDMGSSGDEQAAIRSWARTNIGTLILSPTRELASQLAVEASKLASHHKGFQVHLLCGGVSKDKQIKAFKNGSLDIVVATPGRLLDLIRSQPIFADAARTTGTVRHSKPYSSHLSYPLGHHGRSRHTARHGFP